MFGQHSASAANTNSTSSCGGRPRSTRTLLWVFAVGSLALLGACGGSDSDQSSSVGGSDTDQAETTAAAAEGEMFDPAEIAACLDEAGFQTETSGDLLSEQQVEDQATAFGQIESLTFDAATNSFAGNVSFYETPELAAERAQDLGDVAKAQVVVGNALINIAAGTDFDEAVAASESCLSN